MQSQPEIRTRRPDEPPLFDVLFSSKPRHSYAPAPLVFAALLHVGLFAVMIVLSHPFQPRPAQSVFQPISVVVVDEDEVLLPLPLGRAAAPLSATAVERAPAGGPPLVFRPGPLQPIDIPTEAAAPAAEPGPGTPEGTGNEGRSLADRLRPNSVDPRLFTSPVLPPGVAPAEAVRARIADQLAAYNDSLAAEAAAAARATDWTIKGENGERWGVSPGKIHLGNITLPLPLAFSAPPGRRDEIAGRVRDWTEIQQQANREAVRESFNERVKLIRARKEKEREAAKKNQEVTSGN